MKRLLAVVAFVCLATVAQAGTIPLTGLVRDPSGNAFNGTLRMQLSYSAALDSCSNSIVVATMVQFSIRNGILPTNAKITGNDCIAPANTYYTAQYVNTTGTVIAQNKYYVTGAQFNISSAVPTPLTTSSISFDLTPYIPPLTTRDCSRETGGNFSAKLISCIANLPATGGIADARSLQGAQIASSPIIINKPVRVLLGSLTLTSSASPVFSSTVIGTSVEGLSFDTTTIITSSDTGDVFQANADRLNIRNVGIRCTSSSRSGGAAIHAAKVSSVYADHIGIEPCYNGIQMDGSNAGHFDHLYIRSYGTSTPAAAVWNAPIILDGGDGTDVITDTTFEDTILSIDRACGHGGCVVFGSNNDTVRALRLEVIAEGFCRPALGASGGVCGAMILFENNHGSGAFAPRWFRCNQCSIEAGYNDAGIKVDKALNAVFDDSYIANGRYGIWFSNSGGGVNGFTFANGLIIQDARNNILFDTGALVQNVTIENNRLDGASQESNGTYPSIAFNSNSVLFTDGTKVNGNYFNDNVFNYTSKPNYYLTIDNSVSNVLAMFNHFVAAGRTVGDAVPGTGNNFVFLNTPTTSLTGNFTPEMHNSMTFVENYGAHPGALAELTISGGSTPPKAGSFVFGDGTGYRVDFCGYNGTLNCNLNIYDTGRIITTDEIHASYLMTPPVAFGSLAACSAGRQGQTAAVTDAMTNAWGDIIVGLGANHVLAYCDGTNWTVMAK